MTSTITAAGYVIYNAEAIFGRGDTETAAWADLANEMQMSKVPHESEADDGENFWSEDHFTAAPATAALLAEVETRGGAIAWGRVDGVACTLAEEEANAA